MIKNKKKKFLIYYILKNFKIFLKNKIKGFFLIYFLFKHKFLISFYLLNNKKELNIKYINNLNFFYKSNMNMEENEFLISLTFYKYLKLNINLNLNQILFNIFGFHFFNINKIFSFIFFKVNNFKNLKIDLKIALLKNFEKLFLNNLIIEKDLNLKILNYLDMIMKFKTIRSYRLLNGLSLKGRTKSNNKIAKKKLFFLNYKKFK